MHQRQPRILPGQELLLKQQKQDRARTDTELEGFSSKFERDSFTLKENTIPFVSEVLARCDQMHPEPE